MYAMETAADHKVAVKTEDDDTDIEWKDVVDSARRLQSSKVKEEKSDGSSSKC